MMTAPNAHRVRTGLMASDDSDGCNGAFIIPLHGRFLACIASDGLGWEHVSVHVLMNCKAHRGQPPSRIPTWDEMCVAKSLFWSDEDCVMQLHPPKSQHINMHVHTLHLWRPSVGMIPQPPAEFV